MNTKDDFLTQIQVAEAKAQAILEKAKKDGETLLVQAKKDVDSEFAIKIETQKEQIKSDLSEAQKSAKASFETAVSNAQKKAEIFKKDQPLKIEKSLLQAQSYFITELL